MDTTPVLKLCFYDQLNSVYMQWTNVCITLRSCIQQGLCLGWNCLTSKIQTISALWIWNDDGLHSQVRPSEGIQDSPLLGSLVL